MSHPHPVDFIGHAYPPRQPVDDLSCWSRDVLAWSFDAAGVGTAGTDLLRRLDDAYPASTVIWGTKAAADGALSWELYWYDDRPEARAHTYGRGTEILAGAAPFAAPPAVDERLPYVSFSFDLEPRAEVLTTTGSTVYFGESADGGRSVGLSYRVGNDGSLELANVYQVFDGRDQTDLGRLHRFVQRSAHRSMDAADARLAWVDQLPATSVILARKPHHDGIYFRRVALDDVVALEELAFFPADFGGRLQGSLGTLAHLWFDVGIDYTIDGKGRCSATRFALFGCI